MADESSMYRIHDYDAVRAVVVHTAVINTVFSLNNKEVLTLTIRYKIRPLQ